MSKVIDITHRFRQSRPEIDDEFSPPSGDAFEVFDMTERRSAQIEEERREVRRTILNGFIGACVVVPQRGLEKVLLHDISDNGIAFDLDYRKGRFEIDEKVAVRVYLNRDCFFPFVVKVSNIRDIYEEGVVRHGATFVTGTVNDVALHHFIKFIENVSTSMKSDTGDLLLSGQGE